MHRNIHIKDSDHKIACTMPQTTVFGALPLPGLSHIGSSLVEKVWAVKPAYHKYILNIQMMPVRRAIVCLSHWRSARRLSLCRMHN